MTLLVLWLDACDMLYATPKNMPFSHKYLGKIVPITTKASVPAISGKATRYFLTKEWCWDDSFPKLEKDLNKNPIIWENTPYKIAMLFMYYVQHRKPKNVDYFKRSELFVVPHTSRSDYIVEVEKRDKQNETYLLDFVANNKSKYDAIMVRDDALDAYSHVEIGVALAQRHTQKDKLIYQLRQHCPNMIVFSDHGANHNPVGALFGAHLPFELSYPTNYDEIPDKILEAMEEIA